MKSTPILHLSRRAFLQRSATASLAFPLVSRLPVLGANSRLNIVDLLLQGSFLFVCDWFRSSYCCL